MNWLHLTNWREIPFVNMENNTEREIAELSKEYKHRSEVP
jgi:hypothetical protein